MADVRDIRPDEATTLGMLMVTVKRLADGQAKVMSELALVKAAVEGFPQLVAEAAAENRRYYKGLQQRLDEELGSDYDDISGSHDVRSLRDAGRNWRNRTRAEELAKIQAMAKAEAEELQRKEAEAKEKRTKLVAAAVGVIVAIVQGLQLAGVIK